MMIKPILISYKDDLNGIELELEPKDLNAS